MSQHLSRELKRIKKAFLSMEAFVEENVVKATRAFIDKDAALATSVIESDVHIDEMEVDVEEHVLKVLALHQPVAVDLRFIVSILKINNDLERIGDLAVNICKRTLFLTSQNIQYDNYDIPTMAEKTQLMLKKSIEALISSSSEIAQEVRLLDNEVDTINSNMHTTIKEAIKNDNDNIDAYICILTISRNLERIADHATSIAEDVVYMTEGEIIRHS